MITYNIKEHNFTKKNYICHSVPSTYKKSFSMDAFLKRNYNNVIKKRTTISFNIISPVEIKIDRLMRKKWQFHPICSKTIKHNCVEDFFQYINYDVNLNKKRI